MSYSTGLASFPENAVTCSRPTSCQPQQQVADGHLIELLGLIWMVDKVTAGSTSSPVILDKCKLQRWSPEPQACRFTAESVIRKETPPQECSCDKQHLACFQAGYVHRLIKVNAFYFERRTILPLWNQTETGSLQSLLAICVWSSAYFQCATLTQVTLERKNKINQNNLFSNLTLLLWKALKPFSTPKPKSYPNLYPSEIDGSTKQIMNIHRKMYISGCQLESRGQKPGSVRWATGSRSASQSKRQQCTLFLHAEPCPAQLNA